MSWIAFDRAIRMATSRGRPADLALIAAAVNLDKELDNPRRPMPQGP
jgi:hypothetical protein